MPLGALDLAEHVLKKIDSFNVFKCHQHQYTCGQGHMACLERS